MIQNLDVFLWNRKVGTLVAYKEKYVDKVISVVSNYQRYAHIAGVDAYWGHQLKEEINDRIGML